MGSRGSTAPVPLEDRALGPPTPPFRPSFACMGAAFERVGLGPAGCPRDPAQGLGYTFTVRSAGSCHRLPSQLGPGPGGALGSALPGGSELRQVRAWRTGCTPAWWTGPRQHMVVPPFSQEETQLEGCALGSLRPGGGGARGRIQDTSLAARVFLSLSLFSRRRAGPVKSREEQARTQRATPASRPVAPSSFLIPPPRQQTEGTIFC